MKLLEGLPIICAGEAGPDEAYVAEDAELEHLDRILFSCSPDSSRHVTEDPAVGTRYSFGSESASCACSSWHPPEGIAISPRISGGRWSSRRLRKIPLMLCDWHSGNLPSCSRRDVAYMNSRIVVHIQKVPNAPLHVSK